MLDPTNVTDGDDSEQSRPTFALVPGALAAELAPHPAALTVFVFLDWKQSGPKGRPWRGYRKLARALGLSLAVVQRACAFLALRGLLSISTRTGEHGAHRQVELFVLNPARPVTRSRVRVTLTGSQSPDTCDPLEGHRSRSGESGLGGLGVRGGVVGIGVVGGVEKNFGAETTSSELARGVPLIGVRCATCERDAVTRLADGTPACDWCAPF